MDDEREARIRARELKIQEQEQEQRKLELEQEQEQEQKKRKYETFEDNPTPDIINENSSNLPTASLAGEIRREYDGDFSKLKKDTSYYRDRTSKSGKTYTSYLAAQAISLLSYNHDVSEIKPIYQGYDDIQIGEKLPFKKYGKKPKLTVPINETKPIIISETLQKAVESINEYDRPLVFLITTKVHVIIYIIHEGQLYNCGFGYMDKKYPSENKYHQKLNSITDYTSKQDTDMFKQITTFVENAKDTVTTKVGSIWSVDAVIPEGDQDAKISWICFLDEGILNRIQEFLNNAININFEMDRDYIVKNTTKIEVSDPYLMGVGFLPGQRGYNCLLWAQKILNINIDCGILNRPNECQPVSNEEFLSLKENMFNKRILPQIVSAIQRRLTSTYCSTISKKIGTCLGIKGGKTKKYKKRTNNKRIKKNKKRTNNKRIKKRTYKK